MFLGLDSFDIIFLNFLLKLLNGLLFDIDLFFFFSVLYFLFVDFVIQITYFLL